MFGKLWKIGNLLGKSENLARLSYLTLTTREKKTTTKDSGHAHPTVMLPKGKWMQEHAVA